MSNTITTQTDRLDIIYYTDPLCCWSWAFEPHLQRLKDDLGDNLSIRYCMGGLIESWNGYNDSLNSVTKPIQMGPLWMQASHISGVPMNSNIWVVDPPSSSYLSCIAANCAFLQSASIGERYLKLLRENLMLNGLNIAKQSNLLKVADELAKEDKSFNLEVFNSDLVGETGIEAFRKDLQEVRYRNISRFPTLIVSNAMRSTIVVTGYRTYEQLSVIIQKLNTNEAQNQPVKSTENN